MKNIVEKSTEFYSFSDLNNLSFYLFCPSLDPEEKEKIINIITNNNGVRKKKIKYNIFILELHFITKIQSNYSYRRPKFF